VSEWENGSSQPHRMSRRLLHFVAEESNFYSVDGGQTEDQRDDDSLLEVNLRPSAPGALGEQPANYGLTLTEHELVSLWLLGRVPETVLPWPVSRHGRAGRGPGPDIREAGFQHPSGVPLGCDIEVHLRVSDFVRHGHLADPS